jgi:hypothetical protein
MNPRESILPQLRKLAGTIPCTLCLYKGGNNIEDDGGCRHRPDVNTNLFDLEVFSRLERAVIAFHDSREKCR